VIVIPPLHFSSFISQRGNMHMLPGIGGGESTVDMPGVVEDGVAPRDPIMAERSNIIILLMANSFGGADPASSCSPRDDRTIPFALPLANPVGEHG
jgi:hypothetical protein